MCTAINETTKYHLFGRTLDLEYSLNEEIVITPRRYQFDFLHEGKLYEHYAVVGTAHIERGIPLYYDGMNEKGLCAAALRFPALAQYREKTEGKQNLTSFELIPWLLCNFDSAKSAKKALENVNITPESFSAALTSTPLHWMVGDRESAFVIESVADGIKIYDNAIGVLTNAPEFSTLCHLYDKQTESGDPLPGDLSSTSRFLRAANAKTYTLLADKKIPSVSRFFHVLGTVNQPSGLFRADERQLRTVYTSCMDSEQLIYYFTTYDCRKIRGVRLKNAHLDLDTLLSFPMKRKEWVHFLN